MTKKEQEPRNRDENDDQDRERHPKDKDYNPDITAEDKEVLNNQSQDERKGDYFEDREEPIDYEGDDLDIPDLDEKQFNQSVNKPDDNELEERPKDSANTNDNLEPDAETIYKNEDAEKYRDPSKKSVPDSKRPAGTDPQARQESEEVREHQDPSNWSDDKKPDKDGGIL